MTKAELILAAFYEKRTALNELVHAVERFEVPEPPEFPSWESSPQGFEEKKSEALTLEEAKALGLEWQNHASKLDDVLTEIDFDELRDAVVELQGARGERSRGALADQHVRGGIAAEGVTK